MGVEPGKRNLGEELDRHIYIDSVYLQRVAARSCIAGC